MFAIDFTKPFLYKDIIYFNQGNLAANNILRCKLITGGDESLEGYIATVTFKTLSHSEINESVDIVDNKNCIVDIKFPSNALEVGVNELEVILTKGEGIDKVVTPSPVIKYEVWQCLTTGNGIQGDSNYPILIDLMSEVNNTVRIANNASATADASLKQTAKMLEVVNTNITKANEAIDNTNSAKDKALNAVLEVNTAKDNLISEVNTTKNAVVADVNSTKKFVINDISTTKQNMITDIDKSKEAMITDTNKAIDKMNKDFEALTASQQQDMEVIKARGKYDSLSQRFENLDKDLLKAKELATTTVTTESNFAAIEETTNGYVEDIKLEGKTLVVNFKNEEVPQGTEGATLKSVGDGVDEIVVSSVNENLSISELEPGDLTWVGGGNYTDPKRTRTKDYVSIPMNIKYIYLKNNTSFGGQINFYDINKNGIVVRDGNATGVAYQQNTAIAIPPGCAYVRYTIISPINTITEHGLYLNTPPSNYVKGKSDAKPLLYKADDGTWKKPPLHGIWEGDKSICTNDIEKQSNGSYKFIDRLDKVVFTGNETCIDVTSSDELSGTGLYMAFKITNYKAKGYVTPSISNKFLSTTFKDFKTFNSSCVAVDNHGIAFKILKTELSTENVEGFKALLKKWHDAGAPLEVVFQREQEKVYECTPIDLITFENETNYLIESGAISPKSNLKCVSFIGNVINTLKEKVSYLEDKLYKTNLANFTVALNTLDTKLKLEQLTKTPR